MLFQNTPTALDEIVLALIRRIIEEMNRLADEIDKLHHAFEGYCQLKFREEI
jgi:hypothetical protein